MKADKMREGVNIAVVRLGKISSKGVSIEM
jgi:hypothetical protein